MKESIKKNVLTTSLAAALAAAMAVWGGVRLRTFKEKQVTL